MNLLWIAAGGALGALCRYGLQEAVQMPLQKALGWSFAWGTLCVNCLGCFAIGLAYHLVTLPQVPSGLRFAAIVGFLGAFTTFSTYALENVEFLRDGDWFRTGLYILGSNVAGIILALLGFALGRTIHHAWS